MKACKDHGLLVLHFKLYFVCIKHVMKLRDFESLKLGNHVYATTV
jgi:hypothetical protein